MTVFRIAVLCLSLFATKMLIAAQGILTSWAPAAIRQTLKPATSTDVSLTFDYDNSSSAPVGYFIYVQDNSGCPISSSSHTWIPLNTTSGSIPVGSIGSATVSVPLNTNGGLAYGTYMTNVCFVGNESTDPTNVAVPVTLKSVATDDVFMDGFE
jgi:hypothetical protein